MSMSNSTTWDDIEDFIFNPDYGNKAIVHSNVLAPSISISFYIIITYIGPHIMRNRKPYKIKNIVIFYNIVMIVLNLYVACGLLLYGRGNFVEYLCPLDPQYQFRKLITILRPYAWLFFLLKYAEFLDSIFFIMKKKFDHLTVLHRIHHASMPVIIIFFMRNSLSICAYLAVLFNSTIHVIMYFYYALAACGPKFRKYLFWKKYLTTLQMVQFAANIVCICTNAFSGCYPTDSAEICTVCISALFLILFLNYFIRQLVKIPDSTQKVTK